MKRIMAVLTVLFVAIALWLAADLIIKRDWYITDAVIDEVCLPDGIFVGSYFTENGDYLTEQILFRSVIYSGSGNDSYKRALNLYGQTVTILVDPYSSDVARYDDRIVGMVVGTVLAVNTAFVAVLAHRKGKLSR